MILVIAAKKMADSQVMMVAPALTAARFSVIVLRVTVVKSLTAASVAMGQRFRPDDLARGWNPLEVDSLCRSLYEILLVLVSSEHLDVPCNLVNTAC